MLLPTYQNESFGSKTDLKKVWLSLLPQYIVILHQCSVSVLDISVFWQKNCITQYTQALTGHRFCCCLLCLGNAKTFLAYQSPPAKSSTFVPKYIYVMYMDLSKAFGIINLDLLLAKLRAYGFTTSAALNFLCSYLKNKKQKVVIYNKRSSSEVVIADISQGSIDLILFLHNTVLNNYAMTTTFMQSLLIKMKLKACLPKTFRQ